jgi:hypothetical protein
MCAFWLFVIVNMGKSVGSNSRPWWIDYSPRLDVDEESLPSHISPIDNRSLVSMYFRAFHELVTFIAFVSNRNLSELYIEWPSIDITFSLLEFSPTRIDLILTSRTTIFPTSPLDLSRLLISLFHSDPDFMSRTK